MDAGANVGWLTLFIANYISKTNGAWEVYMVESNPSILPYLYGSVVESGLAPLI